MTDIVFCNVLLLQYQTLCIHIYILQEKEADIFSFLYFKYFNIGKDD